MIAFVAIAGGPSRLPASGVAVCDGDFGPHVGITYQGSARTRHVLHLKWDHDLQNESLTQLQKPNARQRPSAQSQDSALSWFVVSPAIDSVELDVLADFCARVARRHPDIPFGLRFVATKMTDQGDVSLGPRESGLTCATFVMVMFEYARIPLLQRETWQPRPGDVAFFTAVTKTLRGTRAQRRKSLSGAEASERIETEREWPSVRYRAEEVAAASAYGDRPLAFADAEAAGRALSEMFYNVSSGRPPDPR